MKLNNLFNLLFLGSALLIATSGCKKHPYGVTNLPNGQTRNPVADAGPIPSSVPIAPPIDTSTSGLTSTPTTTGGGTLGPGHPGWAEDHEALKNNSIHFDFDKSAIKTGDQSKLEDIAAYLKSHADAAVKIEGNCDERGTEEYNRSLGERRALAAREYLVRLGIDSGRVDTISYGEDRPAEPGHNEEAWSKNRRDDFVVLTQPKP